MERYEVFYKDELIGMLSVNSAGRYCYEPIPDGVEAVKDSACLLRVMIDGSDGFGEPIPFFQNRLMNMKRFGLHQVNYQTDYYLIREITD